MPLQPAQLPPPPRHHVPRQALTELLLSEDCRVRLLLGPAGSGKTTLMADCARLAGAPRVVWLSLGNLGQESFYALLHESLTGSPYRDLQALEAHLLNLREPLWIMLDDLGNGLDKALEHLLALRCGQVRWWLATRRRPACNLPRLLIEHELLELGSDALFFTPQELQALLASQGCASDAHSVRRLHEETQGWCAAVSIQLQAVRHGAAAQPLEANALFREYLQRELLAELPAALHEALRRLAGIPRFNAGLCTHLQGDGHAQDWIEALQGRGLLVRLASTDSDWFRVLPAIARPLSRQLPKARTRDLHRQACAWLESQGELRLAIDHALESEQPEKAAELLERLYRQMRNSDLLHGHMVGKCLAWAEELPATLLHGTPTLVILNAFIQALALRPQPGEAALARLAHFLPAPNRKQQRQLIASAQVIQATLDHSQGDLARARDNCLQALQYLAPRDWAMRQTCWYILSRQHLFYGELAQAEAVIQEGLKGARAAGVITVETIAELFQAALLEARGELATALQLLDWRHEQIFHSPYRATGITGRLNIRRGVLRLRCGQPELARQQLVEGYATALDTHDPIAFQALVVLARIAEREGDPERAGRLLLEAEHLVQSRQIAEAVYRSVIDLGMARLLLRQKAHARAEALLARILARHRGEQAPYTPDSGAELRHECERLLARAVAAQGRHREALERLESGLALVRQQGLRAEECEYLLSLAQIGHLAGEPQARDWLQQGQALAEDMGLLQPLEELRGSSPQPPKSAAGPLSAREIEVLRLVAEGHSNREIGERLFISVFTVKCHVQTLAGKLGVKRRTQAVARAKVLGLLP